MIAGGRVRFTAGARALHHRNFRLFFFGQLISLIGTWMQATAQQWLMLTLVGADRAAGYLGLLGIAQFVPVMILGLFGGMIADLWPKRMTLVLTQVASAILALVLAALVLSGTVEVWHVLVLGFLLGIVNAVDMPTRQAFVVEMVGREDVANAVGLNSAVFNTARIVGPSVAGLAIGAIGTGLCFLLNGLSFLAVIAGLLWMRDEDLRPADRLAMPKSVRAIADNLAEGLFYVWKTPVVLLAVAVIGLISTFGMNFNVILPSIAGGVLKVGPEGFGFLQTAMGVGALLAALTVASLGRPMIRIMLGGAALTAIAEIVLSATTSYFVAMASVFLVGMGAIAMAITCNSLVQITVPGALRGRVMSVYTTVFAGSTPLGNGLTGAVATGWGTPAAVFMNGAGSLVVVALATVAVLQGKVPRVGPAGGGGAGRDTRPEVAVRSSVPATAAGTPPPVSAKSPNGVGAGMRE